MFLTPQMLFFLIVPLGHTLVESTNIACTPIMV